MKYIKEILQQFTPKQRFFVLILLLIFISGTYVTTSYLKSPQKSCYDLMQLNQKYLDDFIKISNIIRETKMNELNLDSMNKGFDYTIGDNNIETESQNTQIINSDNEIILDSILKITEKTLKK